MLIKYRDNLGYVVEEVDEYGISFCGGIAYVNDKEIPVCNLEKITDDE